MSCGPMISQFGLRRNALKDHIYKFPQMRNDSVMKIEIVSPIALSLVLANAICGCDRNGMGVSKGLADGGADTAQVADLAIQDAVGASEAGAVDLNAPDVGGMESTGAVDLGSQDPGREAGMATGEVSGYGGDGLVYSATWEGGNRVLKPVEYYDSIGTTYFHFLLDDQMWPSAEWGIRSDSWWITCANGGALTGIGGDGKVYAATWSHVDQRLRPLAYNLQGVRFFSFTLDGTAWPSSDWGIRANSWTIVCF